MNSDVAGAATSIDDFLVVPSRAEMQRPVAATPREPSQRVCAGDDAPWKATARVAERPSAPQVSKVGQGAFGKVCLARKKSDDTLHAIKAVPKDRLVASGPKAVGHIKDEARILQMVDHPFLVTLHFAFLDATTVYLVTNYVGGPGTVYDLVGRRGVLKEELGVFYAAQVSIVLEYLHDLDILYRRPRRNLPSRPSSPPRNIHVVAAAPPRLVSTEYPPRGSDPPPRNNTSTTSQVPRRQARKLDHRPRRLPRALRLRSRQGTTQWRANKDVLRHPVVYGTRGLKA